MNIATSAARAAYAAVRFLWRLLPRRWRDAAHRMCYGRDPLRAAAGASSLLLLRLGRRLPYRLRRAASHACHRGLPREARRRMHESLRACFEAGSGPSFLFLPLSSWFECAFQRPHQMAAALAAAGSAAVFCEPWTIEAADRDRLTPDADRQREFVGLRDLGGRLHLLRLPRWLLAECLVQSPPDCVVMLWPYQAELIPRESPAMVVYEMVDDHELLASAAWWRKTHRKWLRDADVVVGTASDLVEKIRPLRKDVLLVPNGVRIDEWAAAPAGPVPPDLREAREAPVVVLYYGAIGDERFDWQMWEQAAAARPDWAFVLIGFPLGIDRDELVRRVSGRANLFYLGPKPHDELPRYLGHADVATIPFKLNPITHASSTLKLFEYMAAGKPVVATPTRETCKYPGVLLADSPAAFVERLEEAVRKKGDTQYLAALKKEAEANTWQRRAEALREAVESARNRQDGIARRRTEGGRRKAEEKE